MDKKQHLLDSYGGKEHVQVGHGALSLHSINTYRVKFADGRAFLTFYGTASDLVAKLAVKGTGLSTCCRSKKTRIAQLLSPGNFHHSDIGTNTAIGYPYTRRFSAESAARCPNLPRINQLSDSSSRSFTETD